MWGLYSKQQTQWHEPWKSWSRFRFRDAYCMGLWAVYDHCSSEYHPEHQNPLAVGRCDCSIARAPIGNRCGCSFCCGSSIGAWWQLHYIKVGCWVRGSFNNLQMRYRRYIKSMISRCRRINSCISELFSHILVGSYQIRTQCSALKK